jgi:hypothetical protein
MSFLPRLDDFAAAILSEVQLCFKIGRDVLAGAAAPRAKEEHTL